MKITHDTIDVDIPGNPIWDRHDTSVDISTVNSDIGDQWFLGVDQLDRSIQTVHKSGVIRWRSLGTDVQVEL